MSEQALELSPPDISRWREGGSGVDYVHVFDSGRPGKTVMVQALTHGNELCGAIALDWLLAEHSRQELTPASGRLILSFANVAAYRRFDPLRPNASRCVDEDLNRVWDDAQLFGERDSLELRRARELQPFVDAADWLLDIHSMQDACRPLMVCGLLDKGAEFARQLGMPGDLLIDTGHPSGLRMRDRGGFGDPQSPKNALLIECGQHWERSSAEVAIDSVVRFLRLTGVVNEAWAGPRLRLPLPEVQHLVRVDEAVTARSSGFHFLFPVHGLQVIDQAGTAFAQDGEQVFRTRYERTVLVMPSTQHGRPGNTMVRLGRFED
ncbi:succinylglutamate desuccinylase/aspartoacylase family protein [Pelomonas sp. SE-A7]|uniref:succinylglutamate desuccinylase/aspartoacylase domain-containing protein n=1 Tax=Pelomonas sp. SE-A7 TaxID=3054953 RepID=UPI00259CCA58|nr:succinylglutamate desuccinylase/aspartoacylase family protein [Pelomonas sp. SE-A7]MDM4766938.1 succinylglutamate desuccinylase/aspartoacylase family protein [Pelomonas sp. SE-A7]